MRLSRVFNAHRALLVALLLAAVVLVVRGVAISDAQSERFDDAYHLNRGVAFLRRDLGGRPLNDPPLGEGLTAVPLAVTGSLSSDPGIDMGLHGHVLSPETLLRLVAVWKSLLFLPLVAVAFLWLDELYGRAAAWLGVGLLLVEPTFAAHTPLPTIDVIGVEGIVVACYALWKYHQSPTTRRLLLATFATCVALMLKNTAILMPLIAVAFAALHWLALPVWNRTSLTPSSGVRKLRFKHVAVAIGFGFLCVFALTLFDWSEPLRKKDMSRYESRWLAELMRHKVPAGSYVRAFATGLHHATIGHANFLDGVKSGDGRLAYFPTVATWKLPVGIMAMLAVGVASLAWRRPRVAEWSLAIPAVAYTGFLLNTDVNIGFRHFLPALVFLLLLSTRALAGDRRWPRWLMAACLLVAVVETARWHPNYLSYVNGLRRSPPWLRITDSNIDWGQSLPALREWAANQDKSRSISFAFFGTEDHNTLDHYLGGTGITVVMRPLYSATQPVKELPQHGLFVVSATALTNVYDRDERLKPLWPHEPVEVIDHCLLVYELDQIGPIDWPRARRPRR